MRSSVPAVLRGSSGSLRGRDIDAADGRTAGSDAPVSTDIGIDWLPWRIRSLGNDGSEPCLNVSETSIGARPRELDCGVTEIGDFSFELASSENTRTMSRVLGGS